MKWESLPWFTYGIPNLPPQPSKSTRILLSAAQRTQVVLQRASPEEKEAAACTRFPTKDVSNSELFPFKKLTYGCFLKWWVFPPNHPLKNRVFHYFHHPFWGTLIFGTTLFPPWEKGKSSSKVPCSGICKFPGKVINSYPCHSRNITTF